MPRLCQSEAGLNTVTELSAATFVRVAGSCGGSAGGLEIRSSQADSVSLLGSANFDRCRADVVCLQQNPD